MPSHIPTVQNLDDYSTEQERKEYADGLRALADWVETTEFPIPRAAFRPYYEVQLEVPSTWIDDEQFVKRVGSATRLIGGRVEKGTDILSDFTLTREFGGGVRFRYKINRSAICEARTETVVENKAVRVPKDPNKQIEAHELRARLETLMEEEETTVVDVPTTVTKTVYDCPESLLEAEQQAAAA